MSDLLHAVSEIREHAERYQLAEEYYNGTVGELFCSPAVDRALRGARGGFDINLARRPVDAVLDRVQIVSVVVPGNDDATRRLIDTVWTPNRMQRYSKQIHWAALTYGDAYLVVWPGEVDGTVEIFYNSPITTRVFYSEENPRVKKYAAKLWQEGSGDQSYTRVNLYYADRVERYTTKPGVYGKEETDFIEYVDEEEADWPILNPYGEIPVFHFRTSEPYGRPEHVGAFGPQNAITKLSSTMMSTVDFQAFPQRYALLNPTDSANMIDWNDDTDVDDPIPDDADLEAGPGKLWNLPNTAKVGQFDPANMKAFLDPLSMYIRAMAAATATPLRFFDPQGQIPSGEALRADEAPLGSRIRDREDFFEEEWSEALRFAGSVAGLPIPAIDVQWRPVTMIDDEQGWKTALLKLQAGVPAEQVLTETGYLSSLVESWIKAKPQISETR